MGRCIVMTLLAILAFVSCGKRGPAPVGTVDTEPKTKEKAMATTGTGAEHVQGAFPAQVAGAFYTDNSITLQKQVEEFINGAPLNKALIDRDIVGLISPHAGYQYSGPVAGEAFKQVVGRDYKTVFVVALNHRKTSNKIAVLDRVAYDTPIGSLGIDQAAVKNLVQNHSHLFAPAENMFFGEHSLEVELPFVKVALPAARVVPMVVAVHDLGLISQAAKVLFDEYAQNKDVLFVMSSDLSHYFPYEEAVKIDNYVLGLLEEWDITQWKETAPSQEGMCGYLPVLTLVKLFENFANESRKVTKISYKNSGDTSGSKVGGVVGYGALAFSLDKGIRSQQNAVPNANRFGPYDIETRRELLTLAQSAVKAAVKGEPFVSREPVAEALKQAGAAFVTLKKKGELRGCVGHVMAQVPLYKCVEDVAKSAAIYDTRFVPVSAAELAEITFEISVLTTPKPINPSEVLVGRHGLIVSKGGRSGLLLPQVPVEWNWDREEFLAHTCRKAGLPVDCWKDTETEIKGFEAIVFGEEDV